MRTSKWRPDYWFGGPVRDPLGEPHDDCRSARPNHQPAIGSIRKLSWNDPVEPREPRNIQSPRHVEILPTQKPSSTSGVGGRTRGAPAATYTSSCLQRLVMVSLLILNLANQFGAQTPQANNQVIPKLSAPEALIITRDYSTVAPKELAGQQEQLGHRFKYHLNHLRPPSLVPITIQQAPAADSATGDRRPATNSTGAHKQRPPHHLGRHQRALGQEATGEQLVQLQLPLQLHLKLRPLPLPLPPPPPTPTSAERRTPPPINLAPVAANRAASGQDNDGDEDGDSSNEKRKRSLEPPTSSTTPGPTDKTLVQRHQTNIEEQQQQQRAGRNDLLTSAWREAKRVLLLNSMSPALVQAKLERRAADLTTDSDFLLDTSGSSSSPTTRAPPKWRVSPEVAHLKPQDSQLVPIKATTQTGGQELLGGFARSPESPKRAAAEPGRQVRQQLGADVDSAPQETNDSLSAKGEVRRQRHSSQQVQGQPNLARETKPEVNDARMQAMAAAMLPLVWPSFQLTAGSSQQQQQLTSGKLDSQARTGELPVSQAAPGWPLKYMQLSRPDRQLQQLQAAGPVGSARNESDPMEALTPTASPSDVVESTMKLVPSPSPPPTTTTTKTEERAPAVGVDTKVRSKRRKPSYLAQQSPASSTPYPDSTRLASKYPMPRMKFRALEQLPQQELASDRKQSLPEVDPLVNRKPFPAGASRKFSDNQQAKKQQQQVLTPNLPKSLSRLIEQQLLANGTSLLQHHKSHNRGLAPTTSVSKVVRLNNDTEVRQVVQMSSTAATAPAMASNQQQQTTAPPAGKQLGAVNRDPVTSMRRHSPSRMQSHSLAVASSTMAPATYLPPPITTTVSVTSSTSQTTTTTTSKPQQQQQTISSSSSLRPPRLEFVSSSTTRAPTVTTTTTETLTTTAVISSTTSSTPAPWARPKAMLAKKRTSGQSPRSQALEEQQALANSNKVLPEVEDEPSTIAGGNGTTRADLQLATARRLAAQAAARASGIKLFHFKRKPDMNKLPFYKKPLNYTELGWTPEQIQEHQESLRRAAEAAGETEETLANYLLNPTSQLTGERQKRKRRGKNHFERLMGELHSRQADGEENGDDLDEADDESSGSREPLSTEELGGNEASAIKPAQQQAVKPAQSEERVPVMRKKTEPLVLKPMFSVMNQKRRLLPQSGQENQPAPTAQPEETAPASREHPESAPDATQSRSAQNVTGPVVVRMRRKHQGEQPSSLQATAHMDNEEQPPWRPSRSLWTSQASAGERLLLVPSGILTPSGSHLVPVLADGDQQSADNGRLAMELLAWRPSRQQQQPATSEAPQAAALQLQPQGSGAEPKSNDGLAPSGEESFLRAPGIEPLAAFSSSPEASTGPEDPSQDRKQQLSVNGSSELRVPKLLMKPMRPAKYSLNGYIPKPSLGQQQQQWQQQQLRGPPAKAQVAQSRSKRTGSMAGGGGPSGKDLDSSTSNEVFSRRRGLQQHQRGSAPAKSQAQPFNGLLQSPPSDETSSRLHPGGELSAHLRQLEENKRKYIVQQAKPPTLSPQKANLIKAKLGLIVTPAPAATNRSVAPDSVGDQQPGGHQQQPTTTTTTSSANAIPASKGAGSPAADQLPMAGAAPTSAIPKTDFECTDKKGRFVAGLFADHKTGCQVWHLCSNNRKYSFLCPSGTIFSAKLRICDWKYNVKCENTLPH